MSQGNQVEGGQELVPPINPLGRYLCHRAAVGGRAGLEPSLREAGMTRRQFKALADDDERPKFNRPRRRQR